MGLMHNIGEIDDTARAYFLAKVANGKAPETAAGGQHDGLRYFPLELCGETYWLTEQGLVEISGADV
jgi:hypothetical protein